MPQIGIQVLTILGDMIATAAALSEQHGLLTKDAVVVAVMKANGLTNLASNDADFDSVPGAMGSYENLISLNPKVKA